MLVFCSKCGSKNQEEKSFCSHCGNNLQEIKDRKFEAEARKKIKNLTTANFIVSSIGSITCSFIAIFLLKSFEEFNGKFEFISIIFLIFSIIFMTSSLLSVYVKFNLKKIEDKPQIEKNEKINSSATNELLPEADFSNNIPVSVIENTTKKLKEEVLNKGK